MADYQDTLVNTISTLTKQLKAKDDELKLVNEKIKKIYKSLLDLQEIISVDSSELKNDLDKTINDEIQKRKDVVYDMEKQELLKDIDEKQILTLEDQLKLRITAYGFDFSLIQELCELEDVYLFGDLITQVMTNQVFFAPGNNSLCFFATPENHSKMVSKLLYNGFDNITIHDRYYLIQDQIVFVHKDFNVVRLEKKRNNNNLTIFIIEGKRHHGLYDYVDLNIPFGFLKNLYNGLYFQTLSHSETVYKFHGSSFEEIKSKGETCVNLLEFYSYFGYKLGKINFDEEYRINHENISVLKSSLCGIALFNPAFHIQNSPSTVMQYPSNSQSNSIAMQSSEEVNYFDEFHKRIEAIGFDHQLMCDLLNCEGVYVFGDIVTETLLKENWESCSISMVSLHGYKELQKVLTNYKIKVCWYEKFAYANQTPNLPNGWGTHGYIIGKVCLKIFFPDTSCSDHDKKIDIDRVTIYDALCLPKYSFLSTFYDGNDFSVFDVNALVNKYHRIKPDHSGTIISALDSFYTKKGFYITVTNKECVHTKISDLDHKIPL